AWVAAETPRCRAALPGIEVGADELARAARARLADGSEGRPLSGLAELDAFELYLACACLRGDARALFELRERYFAPLESKLGRMGLGAAQRDDVWQVLCQRLLVGDEAGPAKLLRYAGAGSLGGLVRVAATRLALGWLEQEKRTVGSDD